MRQIPISFNERQIHLLKKESKRLGLSMGSIVRLAISNYFENNGGI